MRWGSRVLAGYLVAVLGLTLWPQLEQTSVPGWAAAVVAALGRAGVKIDVGFLEAASNVVMFLPFGVLGAWLLAHARRRWSLGAVWAAVTAAGTAFSVAIETAQLFIPGRVSTVQDVVLNGAGGLVGAAAVALVLRARRGGEPQPGAPAHPQDVRPEAGR
ncbi:VanZ family protein [Xylanimonas allomyrinae]|uniref:VanZ family protein n=1 Tax=Xylanimonas allomyrinae TaxID=2509459 RepID=UPI0013A66FC4|nr:VanZ family protein [Xylanimonas allomyrinae]